MLLTLSQIPEGASFDVVVVGAGGAGMVAALLAATKGMKVLLDRAYEVRRWYNGLFGRKRVDPQHASCRQCQSI